MTFVEITSSIFVFRKLNHCSRLDEVIHVVIICEVIWGYVIESNAHILNNNIISN